MEFSQFKDQVRAAADIADVIGERVALKRMGIALKGLCPFHTEKTPSFNVNVKMQRYKCFGCGAGGDVFKFIQEMDHVTFVEAVKYLAERYNIPIPKRSDYNDPETRLREAIFAMNDCAQRHFQSLLKSSQGAHGRSYLANRGVSMDIAEEFGIGLSDSNWQTLTALLQKEGFPAQFLEQSGLVSKRQDSSGYFDKFRARLMFPIHNESGKIVGFAGRALQSEDEPKYLNSPETAVYRKSHLLYNLNRAREAARRNNRIILVEGYMDVIGVWSGGVREVVASCGTALTHGQVKLMRRYAETVTVNFDPDAAGARGAEKSLQALLDEHARIKVLELDQDLDPDEYIKRNGPEMYLRALERAPSYYFWLADRAKLRFDSASAEGRMDALKFLLPAVQRIPDKIERAAVAGDLASYLGVDRGLILDQFKKAALDRREGPVRVADPEVKPVERLLFRILLTHPELREEVLPGMHEALPEHPLVKAMAALFEVNPEFTYSDLESRLEESSHALLSRIAFADEVVETESEEAARDNALSCLRTLESAMHEERINRLRHQIRQAQQQGDSEAALGLLAKLDAVQRTRSREPVRRGGFRHS